MKKALLTVLNIISIALIVAALCVLLTVILTRSGDAPNFLGYSVFRVVTGSMEPTLPTGSIIAVKRTEASEVREGDIISFFSRDPTLGGAVNTHRVVSVENGGDGIVFTTKGDANPVADSYPVYGGDLIGVVTFSSLGLGKAMGFIAQPAVFFPLLIVPLILIFVSNLLNTVKLAKKLEDEMINGEDKKN